MNKSIFGVHLVAQQQLNSSEVVYSLVHPSTQHSQSISVYWISFDDYSCESHQTILPGVAQ